MEVEKESLIAKFVGSKWGRKLNLIQLPGYPF
jgi:hypothetical protein